MSSQQVFVPSIPKIPCAKWLNLNWNVIKHLRCDMTDTALSSTRHSNNAFEFEEAHEQFTLMPLSVLVLNSCIVQIRVGTNCLVCGSTILILIASASNPKKDIKTQCSESGSWLNVLKIKLRIAIIDFPIVLFRSFTDFVSDYPPDP